MPANIIEFIDVNVVLGGVSVEKFSFGSLLGVFQFAGSDRQYGPFATAAEAEADPDISAAAKAWAAVALSPSLPGVDQVLVGRADAGDADYTATMNAIEAEDSESWYITNIESRVDADLNAVAAWTETRQKIFLGQSDDLAGLVAFTAWESSGYNRSAGLYYQTDGTYADGAWSSVGGGLNLDAPDGAGIWAYKQLPGIAFSPVTAAQAASIYAVNANLFGRNLGVNFTSKGTMASGRFIDVTTTADWVQKRLEEAWIGLAVGTPTKIPFTDAGINVIVGALLDVLNRGVSFGHFSPDTPPIVRAPRASEVSSQDKIDRVLTLQAEAVLAGAVQKVVFNLNINF